MEKISYRTTMPFDNRDEMGNASISPTTPKSIFPVYNVITIEDIMNGRHWDPIHGGGNWSSGEDISKSYVENADDYKRMERDLDIVKNMTATIGFQREKWIVNVPGGHKTFPSFNSAQEFSKKNKEKGIPVRSIERIAQNNSKIKTIEIALKKCFTIESIDLIEGKKETGSLFCVGKNRFLTCAHVIKKYNKNRIIGINTEDFYTTKINIFSNGISSGGKLIKLDLQKDLALIEADIVSDFFNFGQEVSIGQDILAIGSPHGYTNQVSAGIIGSLERQVYFYNGAPKYMFVDLAVFPGSSGGPIVSESDGTVIGIVTLIVSEEGGYGLNAALPSSYIIDFVK